MKHRKQSQSVENPRAGSPGKCVPIGGELDAQASSRWMIALAACLIVVAAMAAYANSLQCPFVFDDIYDIVDNTSIEHLWPIGDVVVVQSNGRAALHGRPVVNLSLALNHATGGIKPFDYRLTNLLVHMLAGLTLFGIVRRTLLLPSLRGRFAAVATPLALAVALIWTLHPLQTGAVTYVVQRYESMMGLFYLLAIYAAVHCGTSARPRGWAAAATAAALLGMGCKEVAVSIPLTVLLYDRAFLAGSFREALRRRWGMYAGLACAWAAFAVLFMFSYDRSTWAGYRLPVSAIEYARSQLGVILHYLRLSFWPSPLVLDYGWPVARSASEIVPGAVVIGGLAAATAYALIRWPKWGFLGAWFFLILAPTSSIMPLADLAFEHRMYLPLAAVVSGVVVGGWLAGQRLVRRGTISLSTMTFAGGFLTLLVVVALGTVTFQRNLDYQSEFAIWQDTAAKVPGNGRARNNLGLAWYARGCPGEAIPEFRAALKIKPEYAEAHCNLGAVLAEAGQTEEAIENFRKAIEIEPGSAKAYFNLGSVLADRKRTAEAIDLFQNALDAQPNYAEAHNNLANVLAKCGQFDEALDHYQQVLKIRPDYANAYENRRIVSSQREAFVQSLAERQASLRARPDDIALLNETAWILATDPNASIRNAAEAVKLAERASQLSRGKEPAVLGTLAAAYAEAGRFADALQTAAKALTLATEQGNQPLAESVRAKLPLYESHTPFHETRQPPSVGTARP
jgi:protein O-mannosyl-transferase